MQWLFLTIELSSFRFSVFANLLHDEIKSDTKNNKDDNT